MATKGWSQISGGSGSTKPVPKKTITATQQQRQQYPSQPTSGFKSPDAGRGTYPSASASPATSQGTHTPIMYSTNTAMQSAVPDNKGSGSGTAGSNPAYNNANTDAMTGAVAGYGYTPQGLGTLYDNPTPFANDVLKAIGIDNPGMANMLGQYMDPAFAAQFTLNRGKNGSDNDTLNFVDEYMRNMMTPGGRQPELDRLVAELFGHGGSADDSLLGAYLNAGKSPEQQVQAGNAMFGQYLSGQNPYAQSGYSAYVRDQGQQYLGDVAKGDPDATSYIDYLHNKTPLAGWVRGS